MQAPTSNGFGPGGKMGFCESRCHAWTRNGSSDFGAARATRPAAAEIATDFRNCRRSKQDPESGMESLSKEADEQSTSRMSVCEPAWGDSTAMPPRRNDLRHIGSCSKCCGKTAGQNTCGPLCCDFPARPARPVLPIIVGLPVPTDDARTITTSLVLTY